MGRVAEDLKPTLENVSREFITDTMLEIMYDKSYPNFYFDITDEGIEYIEKVIKENTNIKKYINLINDLKQKNYNNYNPVLVINDYKTFFNLLTQIYERVIELYFYSGYNGGFPVYEMKNYFKNIWLRMTPEDFNNVNSFLKKQLDMMLDDSLKKYNENVLGASKTLGNNIILVRNLVSDSWDENSREVSIRIYDSNYMQDLWLRPYIELPSIRYGIYEKNGKKICHIGSIQRRSAMVCKDYDKIQSVNKYINKVRYKLNENIDSNYIKDVEPKNVLALGIFISILNEEGIFDIEVPSMYVLDYEYHRKMGKKFIEDFQSKWDIKKQRELRRYYVEDREYLNYIYNKQDLISEIKTERLIKNIERLFKHYDTFSVISYPNDVDNMFHIRFSNINRYNINNEILKEMYDLVHNQYEIKKNILNK